MKLEIGFSLRKLDVRQESVLPESMKGIVIIFISDLHLNGYSGDLIKQLIESVRNERADLILLGGDYVDTSGGLVFLKQLFDSFADVPVVGIMGNHDSFLGIYRIRHLGTKHKICWLEGGSFDLILQGNKLNIHSSPTEFLPTTGFNILLLHKPIKPSLTPKGCQLVLAGHLHGCQIVLWEKGDQLYPGSYFYRNNFIRKRIKNGMYLISRGINDTLPIRYNCPREIIKIT